MDLSQSHGNLSVIKEESLIYSSRSQYFSVTSSLDAFNYDEVYYSMDEDLGKDVDRPNLMEWRIFEGRRLCSENQIFSNMFPKATYEYDIDTETWGDVCGQDLSGSSRQSDHSDDDCTTWEPLEVDVKTEPCSEPIPEDVTSMSANHTTEMTNSIIEGELSELNDIIYESSISQNHCVNENEVDTETIRISDLEEQKEDQGMMAVEGIATIEIKVTQHDDLGDSSDGQEDTAVEHDKSILEIVKMIEFPEDKDTVQKTHVRWNEIKVVEDDDILIMEEASPRRMTAEVASTIASHQNNKKSQVSKEDDSPTTVISFCCSMKRKRGKNNSTKLKTKSPKSKGPLSFFKFYRKEHMDFESGPYLTTPLIDADLGVYSDLYVPLAMQEVCLR